MPKLQAILISCSDDRINQPLDDYLESTLSLYGVQKNLERGGAKILFDGGPERETLFKELDKIFAHPGADKVLLVNHQDCSAYGGSAAFKSIEEEIRHHEVQLRHGVSAIHAKYPDKQVEAHLALIDQAGNVSFNKIV
jgi:hypothetical protein